jgi:3-oxoacyl-[acyl-carrier protein] reductase
MTLEFAGKTALITGSSQGIGLAIALALSAQGCRVALNGRNAERVNAAAATVSGAIAVAGDVSDPSQAKRVMNDALAALGRLDVLVCNVGSGRSVEPGMESFEEWNRVFAVNLWSATNSVEAARHALVQSKGVVVCISSICGWEVVPGAPVTYSAAKAALHAYVRGMARPLGSEGVRINAVAPGNILFDSSVWARRMADDPQAVQAMLERDVPLRRLGTPGEVADLVAFLASSRAAFATGGVWKLDGGQTHD